MNKETLIAILMGFGGGILVAFLLITVPKKFATNTSQSDQIPQKQAEPTQSEFDSIPKLIWDTPVNSAFIEEKSVNISGTTGKGVKVVISGPAED